MRKNVVTILFLLAGLVVFCGWAVEGGSAYARRQKTAPAPFHSPFLAPEPPLRVVLLVPGKTRFWKMLADYAQAAAEDFGLDLRIIRTGNNSGLFLRRLQDACDTGPDGVIFSPPPGRGEESLRIAERGDVPCFLINAPIPDIHFYPRTKYDQWLGSMSVSNGQAGALLLRPLMAVAGRNAPQNFNILAIGGDPGDPVSRERLKGLENALMREGAVRKFATAYAGPDPQQAAVLFGTAFQKDPEINLVWCASDAMALAVAARSARMAPGAGLAIGGIGWDRGALQAVRTGTLQASVGGQVFEGAWALILLYDYLKGQDFASEGVNYTTPLFVADSATAKTFAHLLSVPPDAIDFRRFSKVLNPGRQTYGFGLPELTAPPQNPPDPQ